MTISTARLRPAEWCKSRGKLMMIASSGPPGPLTRSSAGCSAPVRRQSLFK
jgi:hypothetical protein